jgi:thioesterase domain-containing protein
VPYELRDVWLTQAFLSAAAHYRPSPFDRKVTLLLAQDVIAPASAAGSQYGWAGLAPAGLEVFHVPGTHFTLMDDPNVAAVATALAGRLEEAHTAAV